MKAANINNALIEGYLRLLENLSPDSKLDLISKLTQSLKGDVSKRKKSFSKAFGAWESDKSAEEIIKDVKANRTFNRQIEEL
jgi:hypothetical protein